MSAIKKFTTYFEEVICCTALVLIAICVFTQVIARYVFNVALHWTEEVAAMSMVWAVYMGASLCIKERFHVRIVVGIASLPDRMGKAVSIISDIGWLFFSVLMLNVSIEYLGVLWKYPEISTGLDINQFYPQSILVIGYGLMIIRIIEFYYKWYKDGYQGIPGVHLGDDDEGHL